MSLKNYAWAAVHALIAVGLLFAAAVALVVVGLQADANEVGRAACGDMFWIGAFTFVSSLLVQKKRYWWGAAFGLLAVGVLGFYVFFAILGSRLAKQEVPVALTSLEAGDLAEVPGGSHGRLCNEPLRFSVPTPIGFEFVEGRNSAEDPTQGFTWRYENTETHEMVLVTASKGIGGSKESFRGIAAGIKEGVEESPDMDLVSEQATWSGVGEVRITASTADEVELEFFCRASDALEVALVVCVQTISLDSSALAYIREGLALDGCA